MTKTYRSEIDAFSLTDAEKAALTARLNASLTAFDTPVDLPDGVVEELDSEFAAVAPAGSTSSKGGKRRRRLAVAATAGVLAATLAGTGAYAVSAGLVSVPDAVAGIFGAAPASTEVVEKVGRPIEASATDNGVTITVDAIVGDRKNIAIVYSIVRDDGQPFEGVQADEDKLMNLIFNEWNHAGVDPTIGEIVSGDVGAGGSAWFYDADPSDPAIQFVEQWSYFGLDTIIGRTYTAHFQDLALMSYAEDAAADGPPTVIASGSWKLRFRINFEDTTRELNPAGVTVASVEGSKVPVTELDLSSLAYRIVVETPGVYHERVEPVPQEDLFWNEYGNWDVKPEAWDAAGADGVMQDEDGTLSYVFDTPQTPTLHLALKMRDGSTIDCDNSYASSVTPDDERDITENEYVGFLPRIVDLNEVEALVIGGTEIPLE